MASATLIKNDVKNEKWPYPGYLEYEQTLQLVAENVSLCDYSKLPFVRKRYGDVKEMSEACLKVAQERRGDGYGN
ncbi:unnamed protein product [Nippostrongylus brasiliensis]|uniref:Four helix bundle protein n=1 Tax=Nippostrongylus brasiliensis TaxID=27835 RepID=A0A0N4XW69_NIPBR|nr:unnamed protein product [Nippostrongylus brasiliensis]